MASSMIGTRLNSEVVEQLQKRADAEGKKVSEVVRELIISGLAKGSEKDQGAAGADIVVWLDKLDERLGQALEKQEKENVSAPARA